MCVCVYVCVCVCCFFFHNCSFVGPLSLWNDDIPLCISTKHTYVCVCVGVCDIRVVWSAVALL